MLSPHAATGVSVSIAQLSPLERAYPQAVVLGAENPWPGPNVNKVSTER
jgi:hypothetical protein